MTLLPYSDIITLHYDILMSGCQATTFFSLCSFFFLNTLTFFIFCPEIHFFDFFSRLTFFYTNGQVVEIFFQTLLV